MNRIVLIISVVTMLAITASAGAQIQGEPNNREVMGVDPASTVRECIEMVRINIGGDCGTPDIEAHQRLSEIGKPVVPYLIWGLKRNRLAEIDRFIAGALSSICCYTFDSNSHGALLVQVGEWWGLHRNQTEQEWILDALGSGESSRTMYATIRAGKLTSKQDMTHLMSFLKSEKKDVAWNALYILWDNFQSEHALKYVRKACRSGTKNQKMMALRFCEEKKTESLSPVVAEVLRKESDYQVIAAALDAARKMRALDCIPVIEKMDRAPSSKYPMYNVIRALAALETTAYGDRLLYHLRNGDRGERMAAAEVIRDCVSPENAITPLLTALKDSDLNVRRYACISLGRSSVDKSIKPRLGTIVPELIQLLREETASDLGTLAHEALTQICIAHFGQYALPKVDGSLGGPRFSTYALPIWEVWWDSHGG